MEYTIIKHLEPLLKLKGYVDVKPEGTPYPAFVVEAGFGRGESLYSNNGKPLGYNYSVQINIINGRYTDIRNQRKTVVDLLDGFTGVMGDMNIIDCQLNESTLSVNFNKNYEAILMFTIKTQ